MVVVVVVVYTAMTSAPFAISSSAMAGLRHKWSGVYPESVWSIAASAFTSAPASIRILAISTCKSFTA